MIGTSACRSRHARDAEMLMDRTQTLLTNKQLLDWDRASCGVQVYCSACDVDVGGDASARK